jgi:transposase
MPVDTAYEGNETRQFVLGLCMIPVVPPKANRLDPRESERELYRKGNEVERPIRRMKRFRAFSSGLRNSMPSSSPLSGRPDRRCSQVVLTPPR